MYLDSPVQDITFLRLTTASSGGRHRYSEISRQLVIIVDICTGPGYYQPYRRDGRQRLVTCSSAARQTDGARFTR